MLGQKTRRDVLVAVVSLAVVVVVVLS